MQTKRFLAVMAVGLWVALSPSAQAQPATEKTARELMELTNAGALGAQVMQAMLPQMAAAVPQVPKSFWDEFAKEIDVNELVELVIPLYQKHFTEPELQELVRFYKTPTGQKVIRTLPLVTQESMLAGQQWGQQIAQRAVAKLRAQGVKVD
jgi:uncharacterized protein